MIWHENKPMIDYKNIIKQKVLLFRIANLWESPHEKPTATKTGQSEKPVAILGIIV